jgi:predicted transcriptional regulator
MTAMTRQEAEAMLERVRSWPPELRVMLAEIAASIEATHAEQVEIDDETRAAVEEGRSELDSGVIVTEAEFNERFAKYQR